MHLPCIPWGITAHEWDSMFSLDSDKNMINKNILAKSKNKKVWQAKSGTMSRNKDFHEKFFLIYMFIRLDGRCRTRKIKDNPSEVRALIKEIREPGEDHRLVKSLWYEGLRTEILGEQEHKMTPRDAWSTHTDEIPSSQLHSWGDAAVKIHRVQSVLLKPVDRMPRGHRESTKSTAPGDAVNAMNWLAEIHALSESN